MADDTQTSLTVDAPAPATQAGPSTPALAPPQEAALPPIKNLILDAAPLLTLFPLRGLAQRYLIAPQVLAEIRDKRAREHFERLGLVEGVEVEVRAPDALSMARVTAFAKQTGDYAVLSQTDMCVLALTYAVEVEENGHWRVKDDLHKPPSGKPPTKASPTPSTSTLPPSTDATPSDASTPPAPAPAPPKPAGPSFAPASASLLAPGSSWGARPPPRATPAPTMSEPAAVEEPKDQETTVEKLSEGVAQTSIVEDEEQQSEAGPSSSTPAPEVEYDDATPAPESDDDGDNSEDDEETGGEWITPHNVNKFKARDLGLSLPEESQRGSNAQPKKPRAIMKSACMTSDFAVQNVLLQMGLNLVGGEGRRIRSVRSWVLRCHACFKLCKDPSKKFCPSCGSPTLLRVSITTTAPSDPTQTERTTIVHLKKNYQYHNRGTRFSIPAPKAGSAKGQKHGGSGLILREDQMEFQRGVKREEGRRMKDEKRLMKVAESGKGGALSSNWNDPDWMPEMHAVGMSGKGRRQQGGFLPEVGTGKRNPNRVQKKKK